MNYKYKYLKYKQKYLEAKKAKYIFDQDGGGSLFSGGQLKFINSYRELQRAAKERRDTSFTFIDEVYIDQLTKLVNDYEDFSKRAKNIPMSERNVQENELKSRKRQLKQSPNDTNWNQIIELQNKLYVIPNLTDWVIDNYKEGHIRRVEDINSRLKPAIDNFKWLQKRRKIDRKTKIENFNGLVGLETFLGKPDLIKALEEKYREAISEELGREGGEIIYDGKDIKIIHPTTTEGACHYGKGTKWCTAATVAENLFEDYDDDGPLYIIQPKNPNREGKEKYQLHFATEQYMDESDEPIKLFSLVEKYPEIRELTKTVLNFNNYLLIEAVSDNNIQNVRTLLDRGADVNTIDTDGDTLLYIALWTVDNNADIAMLLVERGVDINAKGEYGYTLLHLAVVEDQSDIVKFLLEKNADVNVTDEDGSPPLHTALIKSNFDIARLLLEKGADINATDKYGNTPFNDAILSNKVDIIRFLLENKANVNATGKNDMTPLHVASEECKIDIVRVLVENGADVNMKDAFDRTPLDIARVSSAPLHREHVASTEHWMSQRTKCSTDIEKLLEAHSAK